MVVSLFFVVLFDEDRALVYRLTAEDALVEWSQAIGFLLSAIGFAVLAIRRYRSRVLCAGMSAVLFLVTGEEISWGQHRFGYGSPSVVKRSNVQGETNLHNLSPIHGSQRLASIIFIFTLSLAIPLLFRWVPKFRERLVRWNAPVFPLWSNVLFGLAFLWMAVPRTFVALPAAGGFAADEVGELLIAAGFVATTAWLLMTSRAPAQCLPWRDSRGGTGWARDVHSRPNRHP